MVIMVEEEEIYGEEIIEEERKKGKPIAREE
jgi:hypothetical protein